MKFGLNFFYCKVYLQPVKEKINISLNRQTTRSHVSSGLIRYYNESLAVLTRISWSDIFKRIFSTSYPKMYILFILNLHKISRIFIDQRFPTFSIKGPTYFFWSGWRPPGFFSGLYVSKSIKHNYNDLN